MNFIPSIQQVAFFDWIRKGKGNAFLEALAGTGKTTSLVEGAKFMSGSIVIAAYNKAIADELKKKIVEHGIPNCSASTFHAVGLSAWKFYTKNKFIKVDGYKVANILEKSEHVLGFPIPQEYYGFVKSLVSLAKSNALGCNNNKNIMDVSEWQNIVDHYDLDADLDKNCKVEEGIAFAISVLNKSNEMSREVIDFDDMIYCPVFYGVRFFQHNWVLVDESQDLTPARRIMAGKMVSKNGRMVFCGDKFQAIYGFTGADSSAVDNIINDYNCHLLPLTVTYRCPKEVVKVAQQYVSHLEAHGSAKDGQVKEISRDEFLKVHSELDKHDAILCRKTQPLVSLAYDLIRKGIACHVEGKDIGAGLLALIGKWKSIKRVDKFLVKLEDWEAEQIKRAQAKKKDILADSIKDKCNTLRVICEECEMVENVKTKIISLFQDTTTENKVQTLTLATCHRSKGREWNKVFILGFKEYMPNRNAKLKWQKEQEQNIIYVAITRAKETLTLVG
tara:strand:- start:3817 stop:5325 length:1509 start_codon:yes stop_codon:yes gene_type:complete